MVGGVLSSPLTVMINVDVLVTWFAVYVHVTTVWPTGNKEPDEGVQDGFTGLPSLVAEAVYPIFAPFDVIADW